MLDGDAIWHFPRHGAFDVTFSGDAQLRSDSVRPLDTNTVELKLGEVPQTEGDYLVPAGRFAGSVDFTVSRATTGLVSDSAPAQVAKAVERHVLSGLPYRLDTSTVSNNAASMHCTGAFFEVARIAGELPRRVGPIEPMEFIGLSLDRWLDGAPSYGGGPTSHGDHSLDDEYVHMSALTLGALGLYLRTDDGRWFDSKRERIVMAIEQMLARDLDDDGLVESPTRRGVSGEHQWSTAWADIISFGWKDAWANAALYEAWRTLAPELQRLGAGDLADEVDRAADLLRETYLPTFLNPVTGLVAGWRSPDGELHDYGFSLVNGAACSTDLIGQDEARAIMESLVRHWREADIPPFSNGLPLNLWRVPEEDLGGVVFGLPMGGYQQGGCSHHHARLVVDALERVGLNDEAHALLEGMCETIADDTAMGGLGSGHDWRMWDGTPSGYEGQLGEGFGVLATALRWYRPSSGE